MTKEEARRQFIELIAQGETGITLDRAALLIAAEEYPALSIQEYLTRIDVLAEELRQQIPSDTLSAWREGATALAAQLFYQGRFTGNSKDYFDARNSFLNDVLERGKGIPITLSVIFIEVARRLGIRLFGVGLPGHFLVKFSDERETIYFDPFHGGNVLTEENCRERLEELYNGQIAFDPSFLQAVTKKQILSRMLQNLKNIYANARDLNKLLGVIERLLIISPDTIVEIRDQGLTYYGLKKYSLAQRDLEMYLRKQPQADDKAKIKDVLNDIRQRQAQLN